ncbi:MAG: hypothetical protein QNJ13_08220 [Paracoccaceae bacterium]|nr:hypothetical protein [Paracoccaceae bacterium]
MRWLAVLALVAACAAPPAAPVARVERVILYSEALTVLMSDGSLCVSDRPGRATGWSGTLEGCPHALRVVVNALPPAPRRELAPGGALVRVGGAGWG